jgi:hypothetical protein
MRDINPLNPNPMKLNHTTISRIKSLMNLSETTKGMTPNEFEGYCELKGILTEWLVVSPSDFNDGIYHIALPDYGYRCVFSMNGSPIEFQ